MNRNIILLSLLVFISCSENRNKNIHESSIVRIEKILLEKKNRLLNNFEIAHELNPEKYYGDYAKARELIELSDALDVVLTNEKYNTKDYDSLMYKTLEIINNSEIYDEGFKLQMKEWLNKWLKDPPQGNRVPLFQVEMNIYMNDLYEALYSNASNYDYRVNKINTVVIDAKNNVAVGETYTAKIGLLAYDSTSVPTVILDNGSYLEFKDGYHIFRSSSSSPGIRTISGYMQLDHNGSIIEQHFVHSYEVK